MISCVHSFIWPVRLYMIFNLLRLWTLVYITKKSLFYESFHILLSDLHYHSVLDTWCWRWTYLLQSSLSFYIKITKYTITNVRGHFQFYLFHFYQFLRKKMPLAHYFKTYKLKKYYKIVIFWWYTQVFTTLTG
jgi:hypothetical protein